MPLKPTMREKWRYIRFRLDCEVAVSESEAKEGVEKGVLRFIGELGASRAKPKVLEYDASKMEGIVRCESFFSAVNSEEISQHNNPLVFS